MAKEQPSLVCAVCGAANLATATECSECGIRLVGGRTEAQVDELLEEFIQGPSTLPTKTADETLDLDKEEVAKLVGTLLAEPKGTEEKPPAPPPPPRRSKAREEIRFECPTCGAAVTADATSCASCGARFEGSTGPAAPAPMAPSGRVTPSVAVTEPQVSKVSVLSGRLLDLVVLGTAAGLVAIFFSLEMYSLGKVTMNPIALALFAGVAAGGFGGGALLFRISVSAIAQADRHVKDGHQDEAIRLYDRAIRMGLRPASAWTGKGVAHKRLGQLEEAMRCQDIALKLDPKDEIAWCNKGDVCFHRGQLEQAIECYDKALSLRPRYAIAWNNKGAALARAGRYGEARVCHDRAVSLKPRYVAAWLNRGEVLAQLGDREEAARCLERARSLGA
ncbi:MAG TPA: tetratricopeptide repeat protein [Thermoplasmata archaeon]|nr:tetratricopeptide repeat protein [Thermoplasmata archaeon]